MIKFFKNPTLKKINDYIKSYSDLMVIAFVTALIATVCMLIVPVEVGRAIDLITKQGSVDFKAMIRVLTAVGLIVALAAISDLVMNVVCNRLVYNTVRDIRNDAIKKLEHLPMEYYDKTQPGDIINRVISDADTFADGFLLGFSKLFTGSLTILGTLVLMLGINPLVCLTVVLLTPVSFIITAFIAKNTHDLFIMQSKANAEAVSYIDEMIGNTKLVKAYGYEETANARFGELNTDLKEKSLKAIFFSSLVNPSTRFLNNIIYALVALIGCLAVLKGKMTIGGLTIVLSYATQYAKPFNEISSVITELTGSVACASRIFEIIDAEEEKRDMDGSTVLKKVRGDVEIHNMSFSYDKSRELIKDFNLEVKSGQMIAIVGPTGCGKTTFINLLMRFYDVDDGSIKVDGDDIRGITRKSLRSGFGMVLQDTWLASGTIKENIAMGRPGASDEEIVAASKRAYAHSFISRLPEGYETKLEEGGGSLSQGQKQLICIARVMLQEPSILILDEATSSIDTRTELKIQRAFDELTKDRTSFIVAHRLSTIRHADMIVVMKDGHILETGRHAELLEKKGFYYDLYNAQFKH